MEVEKKEYLLVDYHELERTIKLIFDRELNIAEDLETRNDTYHLFKVDGNLPWWKKNEVKEWAKGTPKSYMTQKLLDALCSMGIIDPGDYLIKISW